MSENRDWSLMFICICWVLTAFYFAYQTTIPEADKQTLEAELSICQSYLEDTCTAIDLDKDNFRISCKDIKSANDYGRGE